jgi:hypothetical protein
MIATSFAQSTQARSSNFLMKNISVLLLSVALSSSAFAHTARISCDPSADGKELFAMTINEDGSATANAYFIENNRDGFVSDRGIMLHVEPTFEGASFDSIKTRNETLAHYEYSVSIPVGILSSHRSQKLDFAKGFSVTHTGGPADWGIHYSSFSPALNNCKITFE